MTLKSNPSKTFYEENETTFQGLSPAECFGKFWHDIFSLKITTRKDPGSTDQLVDQLFLVCVDQLFSPRIPGKEDQRRLEEQERLKSHRLITGGRSTDSDDETLITPEKSDDLGRFSKYIREIILYNSTPKVNLIG